MHWYKKVADCCDGVSSDEALSRYLTSSRCYFLLVSKLRALPQRVFFLSSHTSSQREMQVTGPTLSAIASFPPDKKKAVNLHIAHRCLPDR